MVVPEEYDPHIDSILLSGKPSTFYLPRDVMELLREADRDGEISIDRMSPCVSFREFRRDIFKAENRPLAGYIF